ncbi:MAG: hypothetical protein QW474_00430 [Candidatus Aenigmatarchaeota archaeon]
MIIKDFINTIVNLLQYDDITFRKFILTNLYFVEKQILNFLKNYDDLKTYEFTLTKNGLNILYLPIDFYAILDIRNKNNFVPLKLFPISQNETTNNQSLIQFINISGRNALYNEPLKAEEIICANIYHLRSREKLGYRIEFWGVDEITGNLTTQFGYIYDNENIYFLQNRTKISNIAIKFVPNDDIMRIMENDVLEVLTNFQKLTILLPAISTEMTFYLAEDGSLYNDFQLNNLVKRNGYGAPITNIYIKGQINEKIVMTYFPNPPFYINFNQNDIYLDKYYDAILNKILALCCEYLKLHQEVGVYEQLYDKALMILKRNVGYSKYSGKINYIRR